MDDRFYIQRWSVDDWQAFKAIRLEALQSKPDVFGSSYANESVQNDDFWKGRLATPDDGAVFGLYEGKDVIGLTGVFRHRSSPENTAIFCMSFIREAYRRQGLSKLLYSARIEWAKQQTGINRILVGHREGNEASKAANQKWGFQFFEKKEIVFGDGTADMDYYYELNI